MRTTLSLAAVLLSLLFVGCQEPAGDAENDDFTFVGGSADAFGVDEGSCLARGALQVANDASEETLTGAVGLRSIAARNLIEARADGPLETLVMLDAVPWIGPVSFEHILAYAVDQGFVEDCARDAQPRTYVVTLRAMADGEGFDETYGEWTYDEDEYEYVHTLEAELDRLPFNHSNGDLSASVSASGQMQLSFVYGDYDGSAEASASVPLDAPAGTLYTVQVSGGEYASGAWSIDATMTVEVR